MTHLGLFEGIGGFSLAARWMGWETLAWCEWNEFCQKVLHYHFPEAEGFGDITKTDFTKYANRIDVLTGGFPCQGFSVAGKRKGKQDDRYLWPEMFRAIREVRPRWVVGENVPGIINWAKGMVVNEIKTNLEDEGFTVLPPIVIPACAKNANHRRDRIWIIAYSNKQRLPIRVQRRFRQSEPAHEPQSWCEFARIHSTASLTQFLSKAAIFRGDDGIPGRVDRIKALGNSIVPQIAYEIFKTIEQYENLPK